MTNSEWQFEEIEETEIESVARGRKSSVPQELIDGLAGLSKGKAVRLPSQKLDPTADTYRNDKARVAASLRLFRDENTKAILNCSDSEYQGYLELKSQKLKEVSKLNDMKEKISEIDQLKSDVSEMKDMMRLIIQKLESNS